MICLTLRSSEPRYIPIQEENGTWTVWDTRGEVIASLDSQLLDNRSQPIAEAACAILNQIEESSLNSFE